MKRRVTLESHMYWERKEAFLLDSDLYRSWSCFAVESGSFSYRIAEAEGTAAAGDLVWCPPETAFSRRVLEPLSFHVFFFRFEASEEQEEEEAGDPDAGKYTIADKPRLLSSLNYLKHAQQFPSHAVDAVKNHFLQDIWQLYGLESHQMRSNRPAHDNKGGAAEDIRDWIHLHYGQKLMLKEAAESRGLTPVQLTRMFKGAYGQTPIEYLTLLRIERAKYLLLNTDLPLADIAEECGYDNGFYLSRVFTEKAGASPSIYRTQHRI